MIYSYCFLSWLLCLVNFLFSLERRSYQLQLSTENESFSQYFAYFLVVSRSSLSRGNRISLDDSDTILDTSMNESKSSPLSYNFSSIHFIQSLHFQQLKSFKTFFLSTQESPLLFFSSFSCTFNRSCLISLRTEWNSLTVWQHLSIVLIIQRCKLRLQSLIKTRIIIRFALLLGNRWYKIVQDGWVGWAKLGCDFGGTVVGVGKMGLIMKQNKFSGRLLHYQHLYEQKQWTLIVFVLPRSSITIPCIFYSSLQNSLKKHDQTRRTIDRYSLLSLHTIPNEQSTQKYYLFRLKRYGPLQDKKLLNYPCCSDATFLQPLNAFKMQGYKQRGQTLILNIAFIQCSIFKSYNNNRKPPKKQTPMNMHPHYLNPLAYSSQYHFIATPHIAQPVYYLDANWHINSQLLSQSIAYNNLLMMAGWQQESLALSWQIQVHSQEKQSNTITEKLEQQVGLGLQAQKKKSGLKKENGNKLERKLRKCSLINGNERFIKKNTQSNVVNQVFSFLWTPEKSKKILGKILHDEAAIELFYYLMQNIKIHCKSQLNRHFLKELLSSKDWQAGFKKLKKKIKKIDEEDMIVICCAIRKLVLLYLREKSRFSIMTSKKMNMDLWTMHFAKCRELISFFFEAQP